MKFARLIAWLLMLALPLQGIAAYAPLALCGDDHAAAMQQAYEGHADHHAMTETTGHNHPAPAGHQNHDDGQAEDQAGGHSCCHHVFSGVPSAAIPGMPAPPGAVTPRVLLLATLFIPELPQRPPRA